LRPFRILSTNPKPGQIFLPTTTLKIIIGEDEGGYINKYSEHWRNAAARGTEVDVLGKCQSACTLVLAHIPKSRLCFGEKSWATEVRCLTILTDSQRLAHWNRCREFIDREAFDF